jgi:glucuronoarabinoxylan endo-1,4-beta-xylanase
MQQNETMAPSYMKVRDFVVAGLRLGRCVAASSGEPQGWLVAGLLLLAHTLPAQNILQNPGFESGTDGWSGFGATLTTRTSLPHTGTTCAYVTNRSAAWNGVQQSVLGLMSAGVTYNVSGWVRQDSGSNQHVQMTMRNTQSGTVSYYAIAGATVSSGAWTQLVGTYSLSVTGALTDLTFYIEGPAAGASFYADDFMIEPMQPALVFGLIDVTIKHQSIEGFGGAIAFYNGWVTAHPYKQEIYTQVFQGLNLGVLRIGNWFRYQGTTGFDSATTEIVSNANRILGRTLPIEMSSWSPPAFLKSNGTTGNGGTLIQTNGGFAYTNFANYWYDSLLWYKTNGIVPTYISIQNEPDFAASWDSCVFHPSEDNVGGTNYASYSKALDATYQRLAALPSPPKILGPEVVGTGYNAVQNYAATMNAGSLYGIAHHLYHGGSASSADSFLTSISGITNVFPSKPRFMTEYGDTDMMQTALLMHHSLTAEEVSGYMFWSLIWPVGGPALLIQENPWSRSSWTNAPPGTTTQSHGYWLTPQYYAVKHFSYFIGNGFRRVDTPGSDRNIRLSAYLSPEGNKLVAVMINTNSSASAVSLTANGFSVANSAVYQTVGTNAQTSQFASLGTAPANLTWSLPGYSLTTVVLDAPVVAGPPTNPTPTNGAFNVALTPALSWTAGTNATSHQVYFGCSSNAVSVATISSPEFKTTATSATYAPGAQTSTARFYWRVDELAGTNVTKGPVWTFSTAVNPADAPAVAASASPSNTCAISFGTRLGQTYRVERTESLVTAAWVALSNGVAGTGTRLTIADANLALSGGRFYRVLLLAP